MNTVNSIQIERPPEIAYDAPVPFAINNTFQLVLRARWQNGEPVNLTNAKIYFMIKAALSDLDAAAKYNKNSTDHSTIVAITNATQGIYTVTAPAGALDAVLTANTNYYVDTEIIPSGGTVFTHLYDTIRPFQQVTEATT